MVRFDVLRETTDRGGAVETFTVAMWLDVSDVFSVQADDDPQWSAEWSVVGFKPSAGRRAITVEGSAETVAARIGAAHDRQRRAGRRMRA